MSKSHPTHTLYKTIAMAAIAVMALLSCGDDSTEPAEEQLTAEEANSLLLAITQLLASDAQTLQGLTLFPSVPCPGGGTAAISGTATPTADGTGLNFDFAVAPAACILTSPPPNSMTFTVDGNPSIQYTGSFNLDVENGEVTLNATLNGNANWALPTRSGSCSVSLTTDTQVTFDGTGNTTITGTMCDHQINLTLPVTPL